MGKIIFEPTALQTFSMDLEMLSDVARKWDNRWLQMKRGNVHVDLKMFHTPRMEISWISYSSAVYITGSHPSGTVSLSLVRSKGIILQQNQNLESYELIVYTDKDELDYLSNGENQIFTVAVESHFFSQSFLWYFGQPFEKIKGRRLALKEEFVDLFILQIQRWMKYFDSQHNQKIEIEHYYSVEEEILGQLFSLIRTIEPEHHKEKFDLAKVREVLHENIDNIFNISDLVNKLDISPRTMQHHFKKKFGMTPKKYLHHLRLNAIRKELIGGEPGRIKISEIALKYGFFHSSHFGSEYKKIFGETPSQTLERAS